MAIKKTKSFCGHYIAGATQLGAARAFYDVGFTKAASKFISEPFGYFGGLGVNSGQEFPQEDADFQLRTRPQYSH